MAIAIEAIENVESLSRNVRGLSLERNSELGYSHYLVEGGSLDMYVSDEIRQLGLPLRRLRDLAEVEFDRVTRDPFGRTNIDPHADEEFARNRRVISRLEEGIQAEIGLPIAIKSVVADEDGEKEDLLDQYLYMRTLEVASGTRLTERQKAVIEFLPVYGAVRTRDQEFLIMKHVRGGTEIEDQTITTQSMGGWGSSGDSATEPAFSGKEHNDFLQAVLKRRRCPAKPVRWRHVAMELGETMGMPLRDLAGRNVLVFSEGDQRKYAIIDQVRAKRS